MATKVVIYFEVWKDIQKTELIKHYIVDDAVIDDETGAKLYRYEFNPVFATDFGTIENANQWKKENGFSSQNDKVEQITY